MAIIQMSERLIMYFTKAMSLLVLVMCYIMTPNIIAQTVIVDPDDAPNAIYDIDWSPDFTEYAVARRDGTTQIVSASTGQVVRTIQSDLQGGTYGVAWHPTASTNLIATAGIDDLVKVWDASTGNPIKTFDMRWGSVRVD